MCGRSDSSQETANWAQTPIYLRATAGMRLLFPDQREAILDARRQEFAAKPECVAQLQLSEEDIRSFFRTLPFMFRPRLSCAVLVGG